MRFKRIEKTCVPSGETGAAQNKHAESYRYAGHQGCQCDDVGRETAVAAQRFDHNEAGCGCWAGKVRGWQQPSRGQHHRTDNPDGQRNGNSRRVYSAQHQSRLRAHRSSLYA
eukprot:TRINITY_DN4914_c0_g3_i1.p2 TRINITY_DN4914_c0_g3~~TRINITY_DN4914_c0_g3_i1.p2  ORF type:complete len:112 (-),score=6.29 TRINITY_DN4914_c0_g3_i1:630-965(-)